ncbi:MAG: diguanylate cyclase [Armatimonadetes bacterium]|nr:diguanylate cyclase [Armatimonadota bacterium]
MIRDSGESCKIVLVSRDESSLAPWSGPLQSAGYALRTATTDSECLRLCQEWGPLVLLLDFSLGQGDPFEVCRHLKENDLTRHIVILMLSVQAVGEELEVRAFDAGAEMVLAHPGSQAVFLALIAAKARMGSEQWQVRRKLIRDELTGVFSRRYLFESLRQHVNQFSRPGPPVLACLMVDVDRFKDVNDRLGHLEGDRILQRVAGVIHRMTRKGDVVARFGGEEFVVVLPATSWDGARLVAEKLRKAVEDACSEAGVTISVGLSWHQTRPEPTDGERVADEEVMNILLRRADEALYRAKSTGRNRVCTQSDYEGPERRGLPRVGYPLRVRVRIPGGKVLEQLAEVSTGGLSMPANPDLEIGDSLEVSLVLGGTEVKATAYVVWSCLIRGKGTQLGIRFDRFEPKGGHDTLIRFLGHRTRVTTRSET